MALAPIAAADWPTLVVIGDWTGAPEAYHRLVGEPLTIAAQVLAERVGGDLLTVPGFYPQVQDSELVNRALRELWDRADDAT